jgi:Ca-activated chloride channel family protein
MVRALIKPSGDAARKRPPVVGALVIDKSGSMGFDGLANIGPSSTEDLASLGRKLARREMTITTIGLGLDYDEDIMTSLAAESGGNAYFARTPEHLAYIFRRDIEDAITLSWRHVRVTITCEGEAHPIRAIGRDGEAKKDVS